MPQISVLRYVKELSTEKHFWEFWRDPHVFRLLSYCKTFSIYFCFMNLQRLQYLQYLDFKIKTQTISLACQGPQRRGEKASL